MGVLRILNRQGDEEITWENNDTEAQRAALEKFNALQKAGSAFFKMDGTDSEQIKKFDPAADEIIAVAPLVGG